MYIVQCTIYNVHGCAFHHIIILIAGVISLQCEAHKVIKIISTIKHEYNCICFKCIAYCTLYNIQC